MNEREIRGSDRNGRTGTIRRKAEQKLGVCVTRKGKGKRGKLKYRKRISMMKERR